MVKIHAGTETQGRKIKLKMAAGQKAYITSASEITADLAHDS